MIRHCHDEAITHSLLTNRLPACLPACLSACLPGSLIHYFTILSDPYMGETVNFHGVPEATLWVQEQASYLERSCSWVSPGFRATTLRTVEGPAPPNVRSFSPSEQHKLEQRSSSTIVNVCVFDTPLDDAALPFGQGNPHRLS